MTPKISTMRTLVIAVFALSPVKLAAARADAEAARGYQDDVAFDRADVGHSTITDRRRDGSSIGFGALGSGVSAVLVTSVVDGAVGGVVAGVVSAELSVASHVVAANAVAASDANVMAARQPRRDRSQWLPVL